MGFWEIMMWVTFLFIYLSIWFAFFEQVYICINRMFEMDLVNEWKDEKRREKAADQKQKVFDDYYKNFKYRKLDIHNL